VTGTAVAKAAILYDKDFYAWTRAQADALRRLASERWNGPLDLEHLAEEVEDLGRSELSTVRSQLERVLEHLLKLESRQRQTLGADG
jgi:DNA-binding PucR family transcriptional regulator